MPDVDFKQAARFLEHQEAERHVQDRRSDIPSGEIARFQSVQTSRQCIKSCSKPVDAMYREANGNIRQYVIDNGLDPDAFRWDKVMSYKQFRNGVIRSEAKARLNIWIKKSKAQLDLFIQDKYGIESPHTVESIRLGRR